MTEPFRSRDRLPARALGFALCFAISWAATALLLGGGYVFVEGAPDLDSGLSRAILFPVVEVIALFVLAAIMGALDARWGARRLGLLAGILGVLAGGALVSAVVVRLAGEEDSGGIGVGPFLSVLGLGAYVVGFMVGQSIATARPSVPPRWPSSDAGDAGPRWPSP